MWVVLQGKFLVVFQHAGPPAARCLAYFLHRERTFAGLQVRDVYLGVRVHLLKLLGQHLRTEVARGDTVFHNASLVEVSPLKMSAECWFSTA